MWRWERWWGAGRHRYYEEADPEQPFLLVGGIEPPGQRKFARWCIGEQGRRHDRNAGIDERDHLVLPALTQRAIGQHGIIAASAVADAARGRCHQEQDIHARGVESLSEPRPSEPHAIDP